MRGPPTNNPIAEPRGEPVEKIAKASILIFDPTGKVRAKIASKDGVVEAAQIP